MNLLSFEIEPNIFCLRVAPTSDFCYNSFLIVDKNPTLIHTGRAKYFTQTLELARRHLDVSTLSYIGFSHFEADECGALNEWMDVAPNAVPLIGAIGLASIDDIAKRPPRCIHDGEKLSIGHYTLQVLETPHCPHGWDACLFFEPSKGILFSSDLGAQPGVGIEITKDDLSEQIVSFQQEFGFLSEGSDFQSSMERLSGLPLRLLATQHGSLIRGDAIFSVLKALVENSRLSQKNPVTRRKITCEQFS